MSSPHNEVQTMIKLGLTHRQAMVYLWLVKSETSTIKTISKGTKIARQHIYKIISVLNELGLVEKILATPTKFKATPIEIGISILMENKNKEYTNLKAETSDLIEIVKNHTIKTVSHEEKPDFIVVSGRKLVVSKLQQAMKNSQETIDGIMTWKGFQRAYHDNHEGFKKCLDKGIKFRHIIDVPPKKKQFQDSIKPLLKESGFKLRYIQPPVPAITVVHDKKEVVISHSVSTPVETPDLWVTNPHLVKIIQDYFEMMWEKATEIDPDITRL